MNKFWNNINISNKLGHSDANYNHWHCDFNSKVVLCDFVFSIVFQSEQLSTFPTGIPNIIYNRIWIKTKTSTISCIEIYFCKYFVNGIVAHIIFDRVNFFFRSCVTAGSLFFLQGIFFFLFPRINFNCTFLRVVKETVLHFFFQIIIERTVCEKITYFFVFHFNLSFFSDFPK